MKIGRNDFCKCGSGKKYKKCCINTILKDTMKELYLYTDESGNTGLNLFDESQPFFWTCTLVSEVDMDTLEISDLLSLIDVERLHANEIGLSGIEKIANHLIEILRDNKIKFSLTRIEKRYLASLKLFDLIFDSGINRAVHHIHYTHRGLRMLLACYFVNNVDEESQEKFWKNYEFQNPETLIEVLQVVNDNIENNVSDSRAKQLLIDGLKWAILNPEIFIEYTRSKLDSPNVVATTLLVNNINNMAEDGNFKIVKFIHDRQNQFGKSILDSYKLLKNIALDHHPNRLAIDMKQVENFPCPMNITSSDNSVGLQITDIALWLLKRNIEKGLIIVGNSKKLLEFIINNSHIVDLTYNRSMTECERIMSYSMSLDLSEDDLKRGRVMVSEIEESRIKRFS